MQWKDIRFARALVGQSPSFTIRKCKMRSQRGWGRQKASMDGMLAVTCCCCGGRSGWKWLEVIGSGMVKSRDGDVISDQTGDIRRAIPDVRKKSEETHAPPCPGPTRQSCRSRESLDSSAQSCAPDPRALAAVNSLRQTAGGLQSVVFAVRQCLWSLCGWRVSLSRRPRKLG